LVGSYFDVVPQQIVRCSRTLVAVAVGRAVVVVGVAVVDVVEVVAVAPQHVVDVDVGLGTGLSSERGEKFDFTAVHHL
jgi:hypothetical protein